VLSVIGVTLTDVVEAGTRFIASARVAAAMPTVFPASVAATPVILAPQRLPQLGSVTSTSFPSATMLTCRPPTADAAAAVNSLLCPIDPYVQQVLELQHAAPGSFHLTAAIIIIK